MRLIAESIAKSALYESHISHAAGRQQAHDGQRGQGLEVVRIEPVGAQPRVERAGVAAEVLGVGLEGLAHAGPLAVILALVALVGGG